MLFPKNLFLLLGLTLGFPAPSFPAGIRYPVSAIDSSLTANAAIVVRNFEMVLQVKSLNTEVVKVHYAITVFKGSAAVDAFFKAYYDNYSNVDVFKGAMFDASGKLIREFNADDIIDQSAISNGLLYTEDRVKIIRPVIRVYPVTLEVFSETTFKRILHYPTFIPQDDYELSVENASMEIQAKEECFPRFKALRLPSNTIVSGDGKSSLKWEFKNLAALSREPLSPPVTELGPVIYFSPTTYKIKGVTGDFTTWKSYGAWAKSLYEGRDSLPPQLVKPIIQLVGNIEDTVEKMRKIYQYLQQTTRYVGVELGIGGFRPEEAEKVAKLGYGDCKGLVNYTSAMLRCAGISSWVVLVRAGENAEPIQKDFPGNQFNHVILCVPGKNDTIWLECTSQKIPFGFLGSFTDDRDALLLGPEGGQLVHTPIYNKQASTVARKTSITVDTLASAMISMRGTYKGQMYEEIDEYLFLTPSKQKEQLLERYSIPGTRILAYSCNSNPDRIPSLEESISMDISKYGSLNGKRIFLSLNRLIESPGIYSKSDNRKYSLVLHDRYSVLDSVWVDLPNGYSVENKPENTDIRSPFGYMKSEISVVDSRILYVRYYERDNGSYPPSSYNEFAAFTRQVVKQDNRKLVLIRK
jgi:transglutaminase-like putative cysteine protease